MAVGLALPRASLDAFRSALAARFAALPGRGLHRAARRSTPRCPSTRCRASWPRELALLGPFGFGNRRPLLAARGVFMNSRKRVGKAEEHLRFTAFDGVAAVPAIAFRCPDIETLVDTETAIDVAFELECDEWRGVERVQLLARDVRARTRRARRTGRRARRGPVRACRGDPRARRVRRHRRRGVVPHQARRRELRGPAGGRGSSCSRASPLRLERQPDNPYDAMRVRAVRPVRRPGRLPEPPSCGGARAGTRRRASSTTWRSPTSPAGRTARHSA